MTRTLLQSSRARGILTLPGAVPDRPTANAETAPTSPSPALVADRFHVLGTPLVATNYDELSAWCHHRCRQPGPVALEFTNTHIVTLRRHDPSFRALTGGYDYFIPDATPLIWCLNRQGAALQDRVYGPTFMRACLERTRPEFSHYLLGGSEECGARLRERFPHVRFVGGYHGRCDTQGRLAGEDDEAVLAELQRLEPDFIWVGLGTPKQDAWVRRNKPRLKRGVLLSVGFAFDVNAGTKPDAPPWMQRLGLTWLYRMASEPRRLVGRYFKFNSLFLWYLLRDRHAPVPKP